MKYPIIFFITIGLIFAATQVFSATPIGKDYPYLIFDDDGIERWCYVPTPELLVIGEKISCWTRGKETMCAVLMADDGFIDCKDND